MYEVWVSRGGKRVLVARFKQEKDAQAHVAAYKGEGSAEIREPSKPPSRRSEPKFVAAKEHDDEFIAG